MTYKWFVGTDGRLHYAEPDGETHYKNAVAVVERLFTGCYQWRVSGCPVRLGTHSTQTFATKAAENVLKEIAAMAENKTDWQALEGDTWPVRVQLADLGCEYRGAAKKWFAPRHKVMLAKVIIQTGDPNARTDDEEARRERFRR